MLQPDEALRLEPLLNPALKVAVRVPDATMDAMRMPLRFFATAKANGADLLNWVDVIDLELAAAASSRGRGCATSSPAVRRVSAPTSW